MNETVSLRGAARVVGHRLGTVQADLIRHELDRQWTPEKVDVTRTRDLRAILDEIAPWWLEECDGLAEAAGVEVDKILDLGAASYRRPAYFEPGNCTSAIAMGDVTETGYPMLLKIRDEIPNPQYAAIRHIEGTRKTLFSVNVLNLGIAHALNADGLAIGNNTGSPMTDHNDAPGLNDCMLTRLLAETCCTCREAVERVQELRDKGYVRGASWQKGTILLMVDRLGEAVVVEIARRECTVQWLEKGFIAVANHFVNPESKRFEDASRMAEDPCHSSRIRHARLDTLIRDTLKERKLRSVDLERFAADTHGLPYALCNATDAFPWKTISASVFSLEPQLGARLVLKPPSEARFQSLDIREENFPASLLLGA